MHLARVVATGAVVLIHVIAPVVSSGRGESLTHPRWWFGNLLDSGCRAAVPLFIMVSGALLLSAGREERIQDFYARRLSRVGVPLALWSISYLAFRKWGLNQDITLGSALSSMATATPYFHLYFLFIMLGLYAATPFIRIVLQAVSQRAAIGLCVGLVVLGATDQILSSFLGAGTGNAVTQFIPYVGYFVAGQVLSTATWPGRSMRVPLVVFLASTAVTALGTWLLTRQYAWTSRGSYLYGYLSPSVIAASIAAFLLLRTLSDRRPWSTSRPAVVAVQWLSPLTFGVYLLHPALIALYRMIAPFPTRAPALALAVAVEWIAVAGASLVLVVCARKVPLLRRVC